MSTEQCIVCLDDSPINIKIIPHLIKLCECEYWVHEICINTWLIKEPVCPICKKLMIYETEELKSDVITDNNSDNNIDNNVVPKNYIICIRKTLLLIITVLIIVIILIFTYV